MGVFGETEMGVEVSRGGQGRGGEEGRIVSRRGARVAERARGGEG